MKKKTVKPNQRQIIQVKNMTCSCCIHLLRKELSIDGIEIHELKLGILDLSIDPERVTWNFVEKLLESYGFEIIRDKEKALVEQIKQAVIELVHNTTYNAMVRNSDYLVERFGMSYPYLSTLFSKHEPTTLEKFTIFHKIEKVRELIEYGELSLSEIAFMMGYSSVQYLSTQFKTVTGISVTEYKSAGKFERKGLDKGSKPS
ncbi:MAG: AraC family transcriptional regulator [Alphaproteobacteria bacterium]|nr:AraC family transcriptional regulator [Alphaproteobacteria bacterium]